MEAFLFNKDNPRDLCLWCRHSVCSNNTSSPLHAFVRVSGQPLWIHQPPFSAARVNSRSWTWVSLLSVKTSDQWTRCLKQSQVNTLYHHNLLTNTPLPLAWLSHSTPSPLLCLIPPFISPFFHTALSCCQSEQGCVTPGESCLAPLELSWAPFLSLCLCVCLKVVMEVRLQKKPRKCVSCVVGV